MNQFGINNSISVVVDLFGKPNTFNIGNYFLTTRIESDIGRPI